MSGPLVLILRVLLAAALYAFLGWALWTMWLDLRRVGMRAVSHNIRPIGLEVRFNKQPPSHRTFSQPEVILGRDPGCDVIIEDAAVSAHHARLSFHHGQWWLSDLESTNGTKLNNTKLTTAAVLTGGDVIKFGKARLIVELAIDMSEREAPTITNVAGGR